MAEVEFDVSPPGLWGMVRLAKKLNRMKDCGEITDWHLGRRSNSSRTAHVIVFDSKEDAFTAKMKLL
jgi:hypothetical protein